MDQYKNSTGGSGGIFRRGGSHALPGSKMKLGGVKTDKNQLQGGVGPAAQTLYRASSAGGKRTRMRADRTSSAKLS